MKKFWKALKKDDDTGELTIYSEISSSSWYGDEVTPSQFKKDLDSMGEIKNLNIYINSPGGDVFAGQAIYSMLKRNSAFKTVYVDGLAASSASVIAMAGDKIIMPANAMIMIHNAWTIAMGNKEDFTKMADTLEKIDDSIVAVYLEKTGQEEKKIKKMMDEETWINADDALALGFADEIAGNVNIAAKIKDFDFKAYKNAPRFIFLEPEAKKEDPNENVQNEIKIAKAKLDFLEKYPNY